MHQQTNHQIFITMSMIVAKTYCLGRIMWSQRSFFVRRKRYWTKVIRLMAVFFQNQFHENRS